MSVAIRLAQEEDTVYLKEWLLDPTVLMWFPMENEREVDDSIRIWKGYIPLKGCYTATLEGRPVGMSNLYLSPFKKLAHQALFSIVVEEKSRGKGIGTALLAHVMQSAKKDHQIQLLHLEVYEGNPAIGLYQKLGFEMYGKHPKFLKMSDRYIDKICMQKRL